MPIIITLVKLDDLKRWQQKGVALGYNNNEEGGPLRIRSMLPETRPGTGMRERLLRVFFHFFFFSFNSYHHFKFRATKKACSQNPQGKKTEKKYGLLIISYVV